MEKQSLPQTESLQFQFSFFRNTWSKESTIITLHNLYLQTIGTLWKAQTECYRKLQDRPDRSNEAKMVKDAMPVVIIEGICRPHCSHAAANLEKMSRLAMYDLDHLNERTSAVKALFRALPYVAYTQTSISDRGLKVVVFLDARTPEEYPLAYAICQQTLERIAGHPCDEQCARITQPCSCVWDADAYYNPTPEPYPWREELDTDPSLTNLIKDKRNLPGSNGNPYATSNGSSSPFPPATEACGYIETFASNFTHYHPWQKGNRHESMLAMGRSARRKGFSKEDLEKLTSVMSVEIVRNGYTLQELRKDLSAGYQYVDLSYAPQETHNSLPTLTTDTFRPVSVGNESGKEEELSIKNEELRGSTPCIPNQVYDHLPDFLKRAMKPARSKRERDILLLGLIANLSGCLPQVRISFDQRPYSPQLYTLIIAPPATGKGLLTLANMLPREIENYLKGENKRKKDAYDRELTEWERTNQQIKKGTKSTAASPAPMPEPPEYYHLCGAPSTSRNQIIRRLKINGDLGLIICATELDMISGAIKQDYGKHDDVFRAAYHHEPVATDYKVDGELICAEVPRLALCLSGTPSQLANFIRSLENGLYCRFGIYTCGARWKYRSAAPIKGQEDYITLYKGFGKEVLEMYFFFQQSPTEVTLSDRQWEEHTAYFDCLLNEVASEQADAPGSIVLRGALMVARIASIFTALRKYEGAMQMKEYICTDEDFHASMQIVQTILNHSLLVASSLPGEKMKPQPMQSYFRIRSVVESLPKIFTYKQIKEKALTEGISERSTCRYLKSLIELKYIEKQTDKYIRIKEFTDK